MPHLLTANSNGRKPTGAWVLAGVVEVVLGHWCTYGVIQGGDPSTVIQCVAFRLAMALTVLMQQPTRLRESAAPGGRGSTGTTELGSWQGEGPRGNERSAIFNIDDTAFVTLNVRVRERL